jgi:predicted transcriptional regulator of viral defense system
MKPAKRDRRADLEALRELAEGQEGYFSAAQAITAGVDRHRLQRLTGQGIIERDTRGIYHFPTYPLGDRAELWRAVLWPSGRRGDVLGTLSHGTALSLYDASTINPSSIDITLPRSIRVRRTIPRTYRLHFRDYDPDETTKLQGLPVTTLFRTLFDLILDYTEFQFVTEALDSAQQKGLLTSNEIKRLKAFREVDPTLIERVVRERAGANG